MLKLYRENLPPIPARMRRLPVERGYPVPWFVAQVESGFDFRIQDRKKRLLALREKLCWLCGGKLGNYLAFVVGPMCAINRVSSEPPSHRECAEFAVKACPFLNLQEAERRTSNLPDAELESPPGFGLKRNPGVVLVWITHNFKPFALQGDYLITMGDPVSVFFWREGRAATRAEILESIEGGYPSLQELAEMQGPAAVAALERSRARAMTLLPAA